MKCARCSRQLKNPSPSGYGPKCATAVLGVQPVRVRRFSRAKQMRDVRQQEIVFEVVA